MTNSATAYCHGCGIVIDTDTHTHWREITHTWQAVRNGTPTTTLKSIETTSAVSCGACVDRWDRAGREWKQLSLDDLSPHPKQQELDL